ncbi:DUF339-domain-containing protein [Polyporus arcularius HHB13444]|uniref:Succinate dehydrogenase assembly factor 2, mitochondrial n=1 Tax=Polyporus arcularius HHB13444 TaxID=1314778 RepID=A0A5C3PRH4_9APHY|nr:DUF339-domain-containing protein [Polyporus arcularius HHB13444]
MSTMLRLASRKCVLSLRATRAFSTSARRSADPWLLPNTPEHLEKTTSPPDAPAPTPLPRTGESIDKMRARLVYQSRKRGTLESDLLLSTFAKERLGSMTEEELREFDKLMDEPDWDIYYWATGKKAPPARWEGSSVLEKLREHVKNEGKVVRRMPDLS